MSKKPGLSPYADSIDTAGLARNWPLGHDLPQLIADVAELLKPEEHGSFGYFEMRGERFDDYGVEYGGDLCEQFGFFLILPEGSKIGLWFHDGAVRGAEPVVVIGSEGDLQSLAPNLKSFLQDWADGKGYQDLALQGEDDTVEVRAIWQRIAGKMRAVIDAAPDHPPGAPIADLPKFIEHYGKASLKAMFDHPVHQEIVNLMAAHIPNGEDKLADYYLQINIAGPRIELLPNATPETYPKRAPIPPEADRLIPLILTLREERAGGVHTGRGLWNSASLSIMQGDIFNLPGPVAMLKASWEFEPGFEDGKRMTKAELDADLAAFPRSERWIMPWMTELA